MSNHQKHEHWSEGKKAEVVASYLILGKAPLVSAVTGVPADRIRQWKLLPWWQEMVAQIQQESDTELSAKLQTRVEKILDLIQDRLENGDFVYNALKDKIVRVPTSMKDSWKVASDMVNVRDRIRNRKEETVDQKAVADILKNLATEFADMAKRRLTEKIIDVEVIVDGPELPEGVRQLSREAGSDPQAGPPQCSPTPVGETGPSA